MSAIDEIIKVYDENVDDSEWVTEAGAELAALRAMVEAQARQLEEAKRLIKYVMPSVQPYMVTQLRAWLAATAPAPQAQPEQRATDEVEDE